MRSILQVATSFCKAFFLPQGGAAEAATGREGVRDSTRSSPFSQQQPTMTSSVNHDLIILSIILVCFFRDFKWEENLEKMVGRMQIIRRKSGEKDAKNRWELGSIVRKIHAIGIDLVGSLSSVGTRAEGTRERERETQSGQEEKRGKYRSSRSSNSCSCHICLLFVVSLIDNPVDRCCFPLLSLSHYNRNLLPPNNNNKLRIPKQS